ncbi:TetR/AcrR family transcriptional regulator [Georgenia sp. SYP-B2076]|uniref:TetR/AcrR family transcriptional regulator n=1 Tax=Georgenia sp. SYP-B2076 TaxID=2495881 RepID=UPI000F8E70FD|nr:TetR/AcrR family transcriptional regulator [Georgenia sp. SYP-B2076]
MTHSHDGDPGARRDPRARRTIAALQHALCEIADGTPTADIDITALCRAAGVHRTTFYKHFDTVSELAGSLLTELLDRVDGPSGRARHSFSSWLVAVLEQVADDREVYRHFLCTDGDPVLMRGLCDRLTLCTERALASATARGDRPGMDDRALALTLGFGAYGLIEAVIADRELDIACTVDRFVDMLPEPLQPSLAA